MTPNLLKKYKEEIVPQLKKELEIDNDLMLPTIEKIVLNMGLGEARENKEIMNRASEQLAAISGQKPKVTRAKKAISTFKLRKGDSIGAMVTLRGKRAWSFLEKLIAIVIPRMRDFRGIPTTNFDKLGNFSMGINEQILFPEIEYSKIDKIRGLMVTVVIKNTNVERSIKLFELLGVPFRKN